MINILLLALSLCFKLLMYAIYIYTYIIYKLGEFCDSLKNNFI